MSRREHAATSSCGQAEASILLGKKGDLDLTEASPMAAGEPNTNFSSSQDQSNSSNTPEEGSVPVMVSRGLLKKYVLIVNSDFILIFKSRKL